MSERRYTVHEIDRMRQAINQREMMPGQSYHPQERAAKVEDMLRTYMANGTDPEELEKAAMRDAAHIQEFMSRMQG